MEIAERIAAVEGVVSRTFPRALTEAERVTLRIVVTAIEVSRDLDRELATSTT